MFVVRSCGDQGTCCSVGRAGWDEHRGAVCMHTSPSSCSCSLCRERKNHIVYMLVRFISLTNALSLTCCSIRRADRIIRGLFVSTTQKYCCCWFATTLDESFSSMFGIDEATPWVKTVGCVLWRNDMASSGQSTKTNSNHDLALLSTSTRGLFYSNATNKVGKDNTTAFFIGCARSDGQTLISYHCWCDASMSDMSNTYWTGKDRRVRDK